MSQTLQMNQKGLLFKLTWPIFIELVLQMLVGNVDQMMMSQYSENAVAAIGNVNTIMNFVTITFSIVTMAITIMVTQYLGSKNKEKVSEIYTVGIFINLIFSVLISAALFLGSDALFQALKMPTELQADAKIYLNIVGGLVFLQALFMSFSAIFRSNGLIKQGMYISVMVNILNIIGNALLLPSLGIMGIAISSVFSRFVGVILAYLLFVSKIEGNLHIKYLRPFPKETSKQLLCIGLPAGGESVMYNFSQMVILTCVNLLGTAVITARVYANMIAWLSYLYSSAVGQANQIIIGHLVGAKEEDEAYKRSLKTLRPAMLVTLIISTSVFLLSDYIFGLFTNNQEILSLLKVITFIEIFLELGRAVNIVIIRGMQASGDTQYPVYISVLSMWGVATLLSYIFGIVLGWGLVGIWLAMALDECLRAVIFYIRWKRGGWRGKAVI
ncbi:MATE family efflux transporter [Turicibacter sp. TJ11]|uniref:MATE family efflux transporter n=1 Tax=Turicibacter sp. TJ11 TaxID=2806443 RepID=UPI001F48DE49|nr:MATE family efflux transporter [Turicibacter sp. TJ11]